MSRPGRLPGAAAAAGLFLLAAPAWAQPAPRVQPARDVVVTYRVDGPAASMVPGGLPGPVTLSWDATGQRIRAEAEGRSQVALIDLRGRTGQAIDTALRVVLPLKVRVSDLQPLTLEGARLTQRGRDRIAGLACTIYDYQSREGPGTVCLTPDGVALRGEGTVSGKPGTFTALAVRYGPVPPDRFAVPAGYMSLGGIGGGAGGLPDLRSLLGRRP